MSKIAIVILIYHRHKPIDPILTVVYATGSQHQFRQSVPFPDYSYGFLLTCYVNKKNLVLP
jgi:hypothetical protein